MNNIDRLRAAFAELETQGIICKINYRCCRSCASYGIWREWTASPDRERFIGAVYFHEQDADAAIEGHGLWLGYESFADQNDPVGQMEVGNRVKAALEAQFLAVRWDGDASHRILIPAFSVSEREMPANRGLEVPRPADPGREEE